MGANKISATRDPPKLAKIKRRKKKKKISENNGQLRFHGSRLYQKKERAKFSVNNAQYKRLDQLKFSLAIHL